MEQKYQKFQPPYFKNETQPIPKGGNLKVPEGLDSTIEKISKYVEGNKLSEENRQQTGQ